MSAAFPLSAYARFARPFTLLAPAAGMVCWGLVAAGARPTTPLEGWIWGKIALGALMAAFLNCASNGVNQIYDREIDAINKPRRPLPAGEIGLGGAWIFTLLFYGLGVGTAALVNATTLVIVVFTVTGRHQPQPLLLDGRNRFFRTTELSASLRSHFNKHERIAVPCHDVNLTLGASVVGLNDLVTPPLQKFRSQFFPEDSGIPSAHPSLIPCF